MNENILAQSDPKPPTPTPPEPKPTPSPTPPEPRPAPTPPPNKMPGRDNVGPVKHVDPIEPWPRE